MLSKKLPTKALAATSLQVDDERYNATQIPKAMTSVIP